MKKKIMLISNHPRLMYKIAKLLLLLLLIVLLQSCFVGKRYTRNTDELVQKDLYREQAYNSEDENLAQVQWDSFFNDPFLKNYIKIALRDNLDLEMAATRILSSEAYYKQAKAQYFPSVTVSPEAAYISQSQNTQFGRIIGERRHLMQYSIPFALSWEADIWGKLKSGERASYAELGQSIANTLALQSLMIANISKLYYQLLILDEQKKVIAATIQSRSKSLETTKALKEAGNLTEVAVKQGEALLLNAEALLIDIDNEIKITENALSVLLNKSPQNIERLRLDQQEIIKDFSIGVPLDLLANRPDVRAAEFDLINAFELTNVAKANFYPSFRITASTGLQSIDIDRLFSLKSFFVNAVASLTQPIWNQRQIRTQHEISLASQQIAYLNYRKTILTAAQEVSNALANYEAQSSIMSIKQKEYEAYGLSTDYAQELVNYGLANYLEVLRAQENELNARMSYLNAYYGKLNALVEIYRALGGGG